MITRTEITKWLDEQVEANTKICNIIDIDEATRLKNLSSRRWEIQLSSRAVRYIAETCSMELAVSYDENSQSPYNIFILYKGIKFFGIESEEEYVENGAVV